MRRPNTCLNLASAAMAMALASASPAFAASFGDRPDSLRRAEPSEIPASPVRIARVELQPGGVQPCLTVIAFRLPSGARNPDTASLKCVLAVVSLDASGPIGMIPVLSAGIEGWEFPESEGGRLDYMSDRQLRREWHRFETTLDPGPVLAPIEVVVTYYDGRRGAHDAGAGAGSLTPAEPDQVRDHLQGQGAMLELQLDGTSAPAVNCRYRQGHGGEPDQLGCDGLPSRPSEQLRRAPGELR
jgi:hypothetical protein